MGFLKRMLDRGKTAPDDVQESSEESSATAQTDWWSPGQLVMVHDYEVQVRVQTPDDARHAIAELKLLKKDWQLSKREVVQALRDVRAAYRSEVASRYVLPRGGGKAGMLARQAVQQGRRGKRMAADQKVSDLEAVRDAHDQLLNEIDRLVLRLERWTTEQADA